MTRSSSTRPPGQKTPPGGRRFHPRPDQFAKDASGWPLWPDVAPWNRGRERRRRRIGRGWNRGCAKAARYCAGRAERVARWPTVTVVPICDGAFGEARKRGLAKAGDLPKRGRAALAPAVQGARTHGFLGQARRRGTVGRRRRNMGRGWNRRPPVQDLDSGGRRFHPRPDQFAKDAPGRIPWPPARLKRTGKAASRHRPAGAGIPRAGSRSRRATASPV